MFTQPSNDRAVRIIQKFVSRIKSKSTKFLVKNMVVDCGVKLSNIEESMQLQQFCTFARRPEILKATKLAFSRIYNLAVAITPQFTTLHPPPAKLNVRKFIAAYMIVCFHGAVFNQMLEREQSLLAAARRLVATFEEIVKVVLETPNFSAADLPRVFLENLRQDTVEYFVKFEEWEAPDRVQLVSKIQQALFAVERARADLPADIPANHAILAQLESQRARLAEKLVQLKDEDALEVVNAAMRASRIIF